VNNQIKNQRHRIRELEEENAKLREAVKELRAALQRNIGVDQEVGTNNQMRQLMIENSALKATVSTLKGELANISALKGELEDVSQGLSKVKEQLVTFNSKGANLRGKIVTFRSGLDFLKAKMFRGEYLRVRGLVIEAFRLRAACYALPNDHNPTTEQGKKSIESARKTTTADLLEKAGVYAALFLALLLLFYFYLLFYFAFFCFTSTFIFIFFLLFRRRRRARHSPRSQRFSLIATCLRSA